MKIKAEFRKKLNHIASRYCGWLEPKEFVKFYDEVAKLGVEIPCWGYWDRDNGHPYTVNGEDVDNSRFVLQKYESPNHGTRIEFNLYFS